MNLSVIFRIVLQTEKNDVLTSVAFSFADRKGVSRKRKTILNEKSNKKVKIETDNSTEVILLDVVMIAKLKVVMMNKFILISR